MATIFVIIVEVRAHQPDKMLPIKDDHMIEQLPSAAADPSLRDAILPGTAVSGAAWFDTHGLDESDYLSGSPVAGSVVIAICACSPNKLAWFQFFTRL